MDIKKILAKFGIEEDKMEDLKDAITREIGTDFIPKSQYQKKVLALNELQESYNEIEAKASGVNTDEYKTKYTELETEYNQFKTDVENEKSKGAKLNVLMSKLEGEKFNKEIIPLLVKEFDLNTLEIEDNNIKEWDGLATPIKERYKSFIQEETISGMPPASPNTVVVGNKVEPTNLREALQQKFS